VLPHRSRQVSRATSNIAVINALRRMILSVLYLL
jgi:hypothetical protein